MTHTLLSVDSRRRVSLGKLAEYDWYFVELKPDGTIVLNPAVVTRANDPIAASNTKEVR